nr:FkbM family methyltransferase [uncultured Psychroserpens sp.]
MAKFKESLHIKITKSLSNNFGIDNFDQYRFGEYMSNDNGEKVLKKKLKRQVKNILNYYPERQIYISKADELIDPYLKEFEYIWDNIGETDKDLVLSLLAFRVLGYKKVKLPRNNKAYWQAIKSAKSLADYNDSYDPKFMHFMLHKFDLSKINYDINLYFSESRVAVDFIIEQYAYKLNGQVLVEAEKNDVVLDIGGCWGDTALYFSYKVGIDGKVYSFEFIPDNIKLFNINTNLNPDLKSIIDLVEHPISNESNQDIYFKDNGPGSKVEFEPFEGQTGTTKTVSIDDFVKSRNLDRINFIKMDIEGAEPIALEGALETIKKFRPKLAIAIYHSMHDFAKIPNWILSLNLDYDIFIGHYTIHSEETICFAKPRVKI